eukprot:1940921-Pyramimonas_sp.AAC.1
MAGTRDLDGRRFFCRSSLSALPTCARPLSPAARPVASTAKFAPDGSKSSPCKVLRVASQSKAVLADVTQPPVTMNCK